MATAESGGGWSRDPAGAVLPVRYNSYDPQTLSIDTIALGFGDPKAAENAGRAAIEAARRSKRRT